MAHEDLIQQPEKIHHYVKPDSQEFEKEGGTVFRAVFVNGETYTVRGEQYSSIALIKMCAKYLENHPNATPADLYMTSLRYHNGTQWLWILRSARFTIGTV